MSSDRSVTRLQLLEWHNLRHITCHLSMRLHCIVSKLMKRYATANPQSLCHE